jgi:hypothetical protein
MANMEIWQRGVLPEARVAALSAENSLAEQFGQGLKDLGQAMAQFAFDVQRAEQIREERDWQAEQPKIAKEIAQAGIDFASFYAAAKAKVPAELTGLQDQVAKWWDERKSAIAGGYTSHARWTTSIYILSISKVRALHRRSGTRPSRRFRSAATISSLSSIPKPPG